MYLESIALTRTLPCLAEPSKIIVVGQPSRDLEEVLPFLATLPNIITYNPHACTLTFRRERGFLTLYHDKVIITQVADVTEGLDLLSALAEAINATWENRHALVAIRTRRAPDRWMRCCPSPTASSAARRPHGLRFCFADAAARSQ